jgi:hypothetical protein
MEGKYKQGHRGDLSREAETHRISWMWVKEKHSGQKEQANTRTRNELMCSRTHRVSLQYGWVRSGAQREDQAGMELGSYLNVVGKFLKIPTIVKLSSSAHSTSLPLLFTY